MFDNIFIISKRKNNIYARELSNERHTDKTERRNWVPIFYGVKSKCQLNCLIYGRVMLLIGVSIFFTGILYTLHKLTEILWDMAQLATCERPPEEAPG